MGQWEFILQLLLAVLFGGLIGSERQAHGRPAGLRTHILVCLGSAAIIIAFQKLHLLLTSDAGDMIRMDPARAAAGIITGIGFLGAGTILKGKDFVLGLTTAASIWVVAAIGITLGLAEYYLGITVTALVLLTLFVLDKISISSDLYAEVDISAEKETDVFGEAYSCLRKNGMEVKSYEIDEKADQGEIFLSFVVRYRDEMIGPRVINALTRIPGVSRVLWK